MHDINSPSIVSNQWHARIFSKNGVLRECHRLHAQRQLERFTNAFLDHIWEFTAQDHRMLTKYRQKCKNAVPKQSNPEDLSTILPNLSMPNGRYSVTDRRNEIEIPKHLEPPSGHDLDDSDYSEEQVLASIQYYLTTFVGNNRKCMRKSKCKNFLLHISLYVPQLCSERNEEKQARSSTLK